MKKYILGLLFALFLAAPAQAANRYAVCTTTCTWDASDTTMWSASSGGATGASVPGSSDDVILDAATCVSGTTCTITVNATITVLSITMGTCTASTAGCVLDFSAHNNNVTLTSSAPFSGTGTGVRTLNMGNGTWTFSGASCNCWDLTTVTNLTFNANSSTMVFSSNATGYRYFTGGGKTYSTISVADTGTNGMPFHFNGGSTIGTLNLTPPLNVGISAAAGVTVTNAFNWAGTAFNNIIQIQSTSTSAKATITASASSTLSWAVINRITFVGTVNATNSINGQGNTITSITGPSGGGVIPVIGG